MKKLVVLFIGVLSLFVTSNVIAAQVEGEFFVGKWSVLVEGTPNGDSKMEARLEKQDGKIVCLMQKEAGGEFKPVDRLEISDTEMTAYWSAGGYNVYLYLEKVDEDKVEGSLMDMFEATGERIKE